MTLSALSLVAGGGLLGVVCARAVPSTPVALAQASFVAVLCVLIAVRYAARKERGASDWEGSTEDSVAPALPPEEGDESPAPQVPAHIHVRVEQEKRRLSLVGAAEVGGAWATAHCLHFRGKLEYPQSRNHFL